MTDFPVRWSKFKKWGGGRGILVMGDDFVMGGVILFYGCIVLNS